jgi:serine/threonine protein kinase
MPPDQDTEQLLGYNVVLTFVSSDANPSPVTLSALQSWVVTIPLSESTYLYFNCTDSSDIPSSVHCLLPATTYSLSVVATRLSGLSGSSRSILATTAEATPTAVPEIVVQNIESSSLDVILLPVYDINGIAQEIKIECNSSYQILNFSYPGSSLLLRQPTLFHLTGFMAGYKVSLRCRIITKTGEATRYYEPSVILPERIPAQLAAPVISVLSDSSPGPAGQTYGYWIKWSAPINAPGPSLKYQLAYVDQSTGIADIGAIIYNGSNTAIFVATLDRGVAIRGSTTAGLGNWSSESVVPAAQAQIESSSWNSMPLIVSLCVTLVVAVAIIMILFKRSRRSPLASKEADTTVSAEVMEALRRLHSGTFVKPREIRRSAIELLQEIGAGQFGRVFKGLYDEGNGKPPYTVAIKTLASEYAARKQRADFLFEAAIMAQLYHKKIVNIIGQVTTNGKELMLVIQYCEQGALLQWLQNHGAREPVFVLINMAADVADGMEYLSSLGFIHRDLAARNVLVGVDFVCKVADFGFARNIESGEYQARRDTEVAVRWAAPECLAYRKYTIASDVWSFAVLLHEVFTLGQRPYCDWPNSRVWDSVQEGYRLPKVEQCPQEIYDFMQLSWQVDVSKRPRFHDWKELLLKVSRERSHSSETLSPPSHDHAHNHNESSPLVVAVSNCIAVRSPQDGEIADFVDWTPAVPPRLDLSSAHVQVATPRALRASRGMHGPKHSMVQPRSEAVAAFFRRQSRHDGSPNSSPSESVTPKKVSVRSTDYTTLIGAKDRAIDAKDHLALPEVVNHQLSNISPSSSVQPSTSPEPAHGLEYASPMPPGQLTHESQFPTQIVEAKASSQPELEVPHRALECSLSLDELPSRVSIPPLLQRLVTVEDDGGQSTLC